jgi:hypothetical protein
MLVAAQVHFLSRSVKGHAYRRHTSVDESKQRTIGFTRYRWCSLFFLKLIPMVFLVMNIGMMNLETGVMTDAQVFTLYTNCCDVYIIHFSLYFFLYVLWLRDRDMGSVA